MPRWISLGFQDPGSLTIIELSLLHDYIMVIILSVIILISYVIAYVVFNNKFYKFLSEGTFIETIWSIIPAFLLIILVLPSMKVLYFTEDPKYVRWRYRIVGHQWYWNFEVPSFSHLFWDRGDEKEFFINKDEETFSQNFLNIPYLLGRHRELNISSLWTSRFLISSSDVIHSFAVPGLGVKVDALPGRINQVLVTPFKLGLYLGQCSEICGSAHSFIPINIFVCTPWDFANSQLRSLSSISD